MLVTMKLKQGLPALRDLEVYEPLCHAFDRGKDRAGRLEGGEIRLVEYSVQNDHLHLIVDAKDKVSLSRGMQGLAIRIARTLNRVWGRKGRVFADRYHSRILKSPREVRNVLIYVLQNVKKHLGRLPLRGRPDVFSSGPWFRSWRDYDDPTWLGPEGPIVRPMSWLLRRGWKRRGLLSLAESPRAHPAREI